MEDPVEDPTKGVAMKQLVSVRVATKKDAHFIHKLVGELAEYQRLTSAFIATGKELEETLFNLPPYQDPTTFILESTVPNPAPDRSHATSGLPEQHLTTDEGAAMAMEQRRWSNAGEVHSQEITLRREIIDMAMDAYKCVGSDANRVVVKLLQDGEESCKSLKTDTHTLNSVTQVIITGSLQLRTSLLTLP